MKLTFILIFSLALCANTFAQKHSIIPAPADYKAGKGTFTLNNATVFLVTDEGENKSVDFLNSYLDKYYGFKLKTVKAATKNYIKLSTKRFIKASETPEKYSVTITPTNVVVDGDTYAGTFYGMQTLLQLLPPDGGTKIQLPVATINDNPRFSYRGMHLDVSRHMFTVDFVKQYIDYLAMHKMNTFHWHLTDDQGWRIEIKKYPKLQEIGAYRNGTIIGRYPGKGNDSIRYGGYYTQEEIKDVVNYAADRFITVIPEIEMPGHASAAIASYPELSCFPGEPTQVPARTVWSGPTQGKQVQQTWGVFNDVFCAGNEQTFKFLQDVLDEVIPLFPSQYVHVGGDESPKGNWKRCPNCQKRIKDEKLKDEHELQSYFVQRMEKYVNSKGKRIIGWDEILEGGLAPDATVMSWRGERGGIEAAKQKHHVIMTPEVPLYFDHTQTKSEDSVVIGRFNPIEKVYAYDPIPKELTATQAKYILGAQANLWTEYIHYPTKVEYMVFPRMSALSEVQWTPLAKKNYEDFERRLITQFKRYELWDAHYSKAYLSTQVAVLPDSLNNGILIKYSSKTPNAFFSVTATDWKSAQPKETNTIYITNTNTIAISQADKKNKKVKIGDPYIQTFSFNKATGKKITLASPPGITYPGNGGAFGLVNGLKAANFNSPEWLGFNGKDLDATITLGKTDSISKVTINTWSQEPSWVYLPTAIDVFVSTDSTNWQSFTDAANTQSTSKTDRFFTVNLNKKVAAKYVRVVAKNFGKIPDGRPGEGRNAWLFVDEIEVE
ncbi:MAG: family 20 glycosylhydrolase [Segetibacter sp.]|nr:family 20 glycosylhydrolase [Segetibacter sp.]